MARNESAPGEESPRLDAPELRIEAYSSAHADAFRTLVADTLEEFGFRADSELDRDLADPGAFYEHVWVALIGAELVGCVALRRLGDRELELKRMYLRPACRGRGVGRRLLETALATAHELGTRTIRLDTTQRMEAARRLYEAYGFRQVEGEAPRQGQRRLLYELDLSANR